MIATFAYHFLRASPPVRSIILAVAALAALSGATLYDARFSISGLHHTIPAYVALLHAFTINTLNHVTQCRSLNSLSPDISQARVVLDASVLTVPHHVVGELYSSFLTYLCSATPSLLLLILAALLVPTHPLKQPTVPFRIYPLLHSSRHRLVLPHTIIHSTLAMVWPLSHSSFLLCIQARRLQPATTGSRS